jgi:RNA polymerase sigma factor (sigma-70 family)
LAVSEVDLLGEHELKSRARSLVEENFQTVFAFLARRVGTEHARDLTAETFKQAIASLGRFDPEKGSEIAWLLSIAHHVLSHHRRSELRRLKAYAKLARERNIALDDTHEVDDRPDEVVCARVARALRRLPHEQRDAFVLVALEGVSYADAQVILCVPEGTLRSRVSRARARLRRSAGIPEVRPSTAPAPRGAS